MKPTVRYSAIPQCPVKVGVPALVVPLDHPNHHVPGHIVTNGHLVRTSIVQSLDPATGTFETLNTIYVQADLK